MSIVKQVLLTDLDYSAWATQRLLGACLTLTEDELVVDSGASHGGVAGTLRHMYYSERVWLKRLRANALPPLIEIGDQQKFQDPPPEPELQVLKQKWPEVWDGLYEWLEDLPETELDSELHCLRPNGDEFRITRWKLILHIVNHSTLHRGQLLGMLRKLGKQPPGTDLFEYYLLN